MGKGITSVLGELVSGGLQLVGDLFNRKHETKLVEQQNQANLEQWNRQNEYNSPMAQMRRMEEAGLNKNLIYGSVNNAPASSLTFERPSAMQKLNMSFDWHKVMQMKQQVMMNDEQLRLMRDQRTKIKAETAVKEAEHALKDVLKIAKSLDINLRHGYKVENYISEGGLGAQELIIRKAQIQKIYQEIASKAAATKNTEALTMLNMLRAQYAKMKNDAMKNYGTNIDKDSSIERKIVTGLEEVGFGIGDVFDWFKK